MARTHKIEIVLEDIENRLTVGDLLEVESGSRRAVVEVMAKFVVKDGQAVSFEQAYELLKDMTMAQFNAFVEVFMEAVKSTDVPKGNENSSD